MSGSEAPGYIDPRTKKALDAAGAPRAQLIQDISTSILPPDVQKRLLASVGVTEESISSSRSNFESVLTSLTQQNTVLGKTLEQKAKAPGRAGTILSRKPGILG